MLLKKKLLIVDDDSALRDSVSCYLIAKGFQVLVSHSVKDALHQMKISKPDMIISDIMMPYIDGYNFLRMLHLDENFFKIPVILLTAKGMTQDRIKGYDLGCYAYLTKPFDPNELLSIINNVFRNIYVSETIPEIADNSTDYSVRELFERSLTYREQTILKLVIKGYTNKEIAQHLKVSIRNVEKYVSRLLNKTSTRNRTELSQRVVAGNIPISKGE